MGFAEEAEQKLVRLIIENRAGCFSKIEKSIKGEMMVIKYLYTIEKTTSPKSLSEALNISSARIAVILNSLEKKDLIVRTMDPSDRRRISVELTNQGEKTAKFEMDKMRNVLIQIFIQMGETDTKHFIELVSVFLDYSRKSKMNDEGDQV